MDAFLSATDVNDHPKIDMQLRRGFQTDVKNFVTGFGVQSALLILLASV